MSSTTPRSDRRAKHRTKDTYSFYLERRSLELVETLVASGVFANASHAVDEALLLLIHQYPAIQSSEESTCAAA